MDRAKGMDADTVARADTTGVSPGSFEAECGESAARLRDALRVLYEAAEADVSRPREVSRRFALDKTLTWKVARVLRAHSAHEMLLHVPGRAALDILIDSMSEAAGEASDAARRAADELESAIVRHVGDRETLLLVLDSSSDRAAERLIQARRLAFKGNSGIWGYRAHARTTTLILAPSASDPTRFDTTLIGGMVGLTRMRPHIRVPLFRWAVYGHRPSTPLQPRLLHEVSAGDLQGINESREGDEVVFELSSGRIGKTGGLTCYFSSTERAAVEAYRAEGSEYGDVLSTVAVPVETILIDLLVHRSAAPLSPPKLFVYSRLGARAGPPDERDTLPIPDVVTATGTPPSLRAEACERYRDACLHVFGQLGYVLNEFCGYRLVSRYPPMPSTFMLRYRLPSAP